MTKIESKAINFIKKNILLFFIRGSEYNCDCHKSLRNGFSKR